MSDNRQEELKYVTKLYDELPPITEAYVHDEQVFESVQKILDFISKNAYAPTQHLHNVILTLGKTGWGKSTTINYLHGNKFQATDDGRLKLCDSRQVLTLVGDGSGSTTFSPVSCLTNFGTVCDLPGDGETRGLVVEIINSISKRNMGKTLKSIKLMLVVPFDMLTSLGSYGKGLKEILSSNDKFLGGINKYQNNIMLIITYSSRIKTALQVVIRNIENCIQHQDKALAQYSDLLISIIKNNRIKLFPRPSESDTDTGDINDILPPFKQWKQHGRQVIVEEIQKMESRNCNSQDFSVPTNPQVKEKLGKFMKILIEKIKTEIAISFTQAKISGVEIEFFEQLLDAIRSPNKRTFQQFQNIFEKNRYMKFPQLQRCLDYIEMITSFLDEKEIVENWCSRDLQQKIKQTMDILGGLKEQGGGNFRKTKESPNLKINPNSKNFLLIQNELNEIIRLTESQKSIELDKTNIESDLYDNATKQVYDKTIQEPYYIDEQYVQYEPVTKKVKKAVPTTSKRTVKKTRLKHRRQQYKEIVPVAKIRKVTRPVVVQQGRTNKWFLWWQWDYQNYQKIKNVQVDEAYHDYQYVDKYRDVPYTQEYQEQQTYNDVTYVDQEVVQQIPKTLTRNKLMHRDKQVFRDEPYRKLNEERYKTKRQQNEKDLQKSRKKIQDLISNSEPGQFRGEIGLNQARARNESQEGELELLTKWCRSEYNAFAHYHPTRTLSFQ